jgi:LDH2 family malate/lactate/ureidoglycolate dehydrogenase
MKIKIEEIRKLLEQKLRKINFTSREARVIADEYVRGQAQGKHSHGIFTFIHQYKDLRTQKRSHFRMVKDKSAYAYISGNKDVGQVVADYAINLAIKKAKKTGIAMVGGGNIRPFLRPGTYADAAARKGMIGLCFNYGGAPLMAPTGAREAILSTNPIGVGIPRKPYPIVIDMATSVKAFYHVRLAKTLGKKINKDWGIDKFGRPTSDPKKLVAVLPFGGYKGYVLALALEILTGPLVRTKVGKSTKKLRGFLFIVIDPLAFTSRKEFDKDVNKLIKDVKSARKIKGVKEIIIPGEHAHYTEQKNLKRGYLEIDKKIIDSINAL